MKRALIYRLWRRLRAPHSPMHAAATAAAWKAGTSAGGASQSKAQQLAWPVSKRKLLAPIVGRPHPGFFMRYIMVGVFGRAAAWGLSWVGLGLFWASLSHFAGIYCLLEAIVANLADCLQKCNVKKTKTYILDSALGPKLNPEINKTRFRSCVLFLTALGSVSAPLRDSKIGSEFLKTLGPKWNHFRTFGGSPPQQA